jgi:hypothetical protein
MKVCDNCGASLDDDIIRCGNCMEVQPTVDRPESASVEAKSDLPSPNLARKLKRCVGCGAMIDADVPRCGRCMTVQPVIGQLPVSEWSGSGQPYQYTQPKERSRFSIPKALFAMLIVSMLVLVYLPQLVIDNNTGDRYVTGSGTRSVTWTYLGDSYTVTFNITHDQYAHYVNSDVYRFMTTNDNYEQALSFITENDEVVFSIAKQFSTLTNLANLDRLGLANLVLGFVQAIPYETDDITYGQGEYWAFPVETLYHDQGDCEDKSFLYASIMKDLDYGCSLLFYQDHAAVGIAFDSVPGGSYYDFDGTHYYYCETTAEGWSVGEEPGEYDRSTVLKL